MTDDKTEQKSDEKKQRVLLVDDDHEIVESVRYALESNGYDVLVARDGNQGLAMAEREDPDLVVLDMMMPKRSGFLVLEKLRRSRPVPLRVIIITANEGSRHKAYAEMLGVDDYIRKPFAMDRRWKASSGCWAEPARARTAPHLPPCASGFPRGAPRPKVSNSHNRLNGIPSGAGCTHFHNVSAKGFLGVFCRIKILRRQDFCSMTPAASRVCADGLVESRYCRPAEL
jgi:CheY-like chemotaxis protein